MRPCFKIPASSTNTATPAKSVSLHAEMVPRPFYLTYRCIAHSWVIPQGHQTREQYPETDSFELGPPILRLGFYLLDATYISTPWHLHLLGLCGHSVGLHEGHQTERAWFDAAVPFPISCLGESVFNLWRAPPHCVGCTAFVAGSAWSNVWLDLCFVPGAQMRG